MSISFDELQKENKKIKSRLEEKSRDSHNAEMRISELEGKIGSIVEEKLEKKFCNNECSKTGTGEDRRNGIQYYWDIGVSIAPLDFKASRISQAANSSILLELNERNTRNLILKKRKEAGVLKMENCGYSGKNNVYFNEDLTRAKQELFTQARKIKMEREYKFAWVRNGQIYIRKTEEGQAVLIKKLTDLNDL
ncbi:hypothetical protein HHI36_019774 [Cryptolaemus montrouzieri]|uniref:FP protein C-terminal domain-containing protein n=1 Tax=Cryptolaemus montrouzieri TaxID=559131 RepID=A0ABD2N8E1_9CUCU